MSECPYLEIESPKVLIFKHGLVIVAGAGEAQFM